MCRLQICLCCVEDVHVVDDCHTCLIYVHRSVCAVLRTCTGLTTACLICVQICWCCVEDVHVVDDCHTCLICVQICLCCVEDLHRVDDCMLCMFDVCSLYCLLVSLTPGWRLL